jgi:hypothetical protein
MSQELSDNIPKCGFPKLSIFSLSVFRDPVPQVTKMHHNLGELCPRHFFAGNHTFCQWEKTMTWELLAEWHLGHHVADRKGFDIDLLSKGTTTCAEPMR